MDSVVSLSYLLKWLFCSEVQPGHDLPRSGIPTTLSGHFWAGGTCQINFIHVVWGFTGHVGHVLLHFIFLKIFQVFFSFNFVKTLLPQTFSLSYFKCIIFLLKFCFTCRNCLLRFLLKVGY